MGLAVYNIFNNIVSIIWPGGGGVAVKVPGLQAGSLKSVDSAPVVAIERSVLNSTLLWGRLSLKVTDQKKLEVALDKKVC